MGEKIDQAKGRIKEAAGDITGDKDLEREGKVDRGAGTIKEKAGEAVDKVKDALHKD
ncbi:MAG: CsbD family protein [Acidimicrobiales bacterium]